MENERTLVAVSIKHTEWRWKFGMPCILWGHRTKDEEKRSFGGYTQFPNNAEVYSLEDWANSGYAKCEWMKTDEPVHMEINFCKKYKKYDTVLVPLEEYIGYCRCANLPIDRPEDWQKMANEKRLKLIDYDEIRNLLDEEYKKTAQLIRDGETHLDNLAEGFAEADKVIWKLPTVDAIVPPVKIGQVLWCNLPHSKSPLECRVYCICREERNGLVLDYFRCVVKGWFGKGFSFEDVGKTVFLTEAEALAMMDGDKSE